MTYIERVSNFAFFTGQNHYEIDFMSSFNWAF
jgi:hypothetical protein